MADNGISNIIDSALSGLSGARNAAPARQRQSRPTGGAGQDEVKQRSSRSYTPPQQAVNLDGKILDRTAPRGTYLNIVV